MIALGRVGGLELRVEVDVARRLDQHIAPLARLRIEQPGGPVEPAAGDAGERGGLPVRKARRPLREPVAHRRLRETAERDELAARVDRLGQGAQLVRDQRDGGVGGRLLEILEQRIRRVVVEAMRVEDEVDAAVALVRSHVEVVVEGADVVDADELAERLDHVEIGVRAVQHAALVAEQLGRERERRRPLTHAGRAVEQVRVRRPLGEGGCEEALGLLLLRNRREG